FFGFVAASRDLLAEFIEVPDYFCIVEREPPVRLGFLLDLRPTLDRRLLEDRAFAHRAEQPELGIGRLDRILKRGSLQGGCREIAGGDGSSIARRDQLIDGGLYFFLCVVIR